MLVLLAGVFVLHVINIIFLLIATISNAWWQTEVMSTDVWTRWMKTDKGWKYSDLPASYPDDLLQAVQAFAVLACVFTILGLFVFVAQLFTLRKGERFTFSAVFQLISCLCIMIAASIYTNNFHKEVTERDGGYGYSFVLAWLSFVLTFISSIIYFVLRKKTE